MKGRSSAKLKSFCSPPCLPFHQSCYDERESGLHRGKPPKRDDPFGRWFPFLFTKSRCRLFGFALTNSDAFAFNFVDIRHAMRALQVSFSACLPACLVVCTCSRATHGTGEAASRPDIIIGGFRRLSAEGAGSAVCYCLSQFRVRQNLQCRSLVVLQKYAICHIQTCR